MKITITKKTLEKVQPWDYSFEFSSDYPVIKCVSNNEDAGMNFVKGGCIFAIAEWREVPDTIQFVYKDHQEQVPVSVAEADKNRVRKEMWQDFVADDVPTKHSLVW